MIYNNPFPQENLFDLPPLQDSSSLSFEELLKANEPFGSTQPPQEELSLDFTQTTFADSLDSFFENFEQEQVNLTNLPSSQVNTLNTHFPFPVSFLNLSDSEAIPPPTPTVQSSSNSLQQPNLRPIENSLSENQEKAKTKKRKYTNVKTKTKKLKKVKNLFFSTPFPEFIQLQIQNLKDCGCLYFKQTFQSSLFKYHQQYNSSSETYNANEYIENLKKLFSTILSSEQHMIEFISTVGKESIETYRQNILPLLDDDDRMKLLNIFDTKGKINILNDLQMLKEHFSNATLSQFLLNLYRLNSNQGKGSLKVKKTISFAQDFIAGLTSNSGNRLNPLNPPMMEIVDISKVITETVSQLPPFVKSYAIRKFPILDYEKQKKESLIPNNPFPLNPSDNPLYFLHLPGEEFSIGEVEVPSQEGEFSGQEGELTEQQGEFSGQEGELTEQQGEFPRQNEVKLSSASFDELLKENESLNLAQSSLDNFSNLNGPSENPESDLNGPSENPERVQVKAKKRKYKNHKSKKTKTKKVKNVKIISPLISLAFPEFVQSIIDNLKQNDISYQKQFFHNTLFKYHEQYNNSETNNAKEYSENLEKLFSTILSSESHMFEFISTVNNKNIEVYRQTITPLLEDVNRIKLLNLLDTKSRINILHDFQMLKEQFSNATLSQFFINLNILYSAPSRRVINTQKAISLAQDFFAGLKSSTGIGLNSFTHSEKEIVGISKVISESLSQLTPRAKSYVIGIFPLLKDFKIQSNESATKDSEKLVISENQEPLQHKNPLPNPLSIPTQDTYNHLQDFKTFINNQILFFTEINIFCNKWKFHSQFCEYYTLIVNSPLASPSYLEEFRDVLKKFFAFIFDSETYKSQFFTFMTEPQIKFYKEKIAPFLKEETQKNLLGVLETDISYMRMENNFNKIKNNFNEGGLSQYLSDLHESNYRIPKKISTEKVISLFKELKEKTDSPEGTSLRELSSYYKTVFSFALEKLTPSKKDYILQKYPIIMQLINN